jgi:TonB family protein
MASGSQLHAFHGVSALSAVPRQTALAGEGLVVLTRDEALVDTLQAVGSGQDVFAVDAESDLASHLLAAHTGVAILDAAAIASPIERLTERLKAQFPDLVLIVAGGLDDQSALATQITNGTVYRFLHKPVSEQRVKLFVDAAWRRHNEAHGGVDSLFANAVPARERAAVGGSTLMFGGVGIAALALLGVWFLMRKPQTQPVAALAPGAAETQPPAAPRDAVLEDLLARADHALAGGALVAPAGENAADLYAQAIRRNVSDPRAGNGVEKVIDRLLSGAEAQLLAQHLDAAQKLTEQARAIKPEHVRVAFLMAQIGKERERAVLAQARQAAATGHIEQALAVLDGAARDGHRSTLVTEARQELEQKKADERVRDFLGRANDRMRSGLLLEPAQDNAQFFIESARALAPNDSDVRQTQRQFLDRLLAEAHRALAAGNADQGEHWIQAAADSGVGRDDIAALTREAQRVRTAARADALARLALRFDQRLTQGKLLDPPSDNAKFYLAQLTQADPTHPSTQLAHQAFSARALAEAQTAVHRHDYAGAQSWLTEAHDAGADQASINAVTGDIKAAQDTTKSANEFVTASSLKLTHYVPPAFPTSARERAMSGWVDVQFVVRTDGGVSGIAVIGAEPVGVFEQAAMDAVRKWRYRPVMRDGQPVSQRARLRVRFALR